MFAKRILSICVAALLIAAGSASAISVSTADGRGADTYVSNDTQSGDYGPDSLHGADDSIRIRYLADTRVKIGYIRFDIEGLAGDMTGATLSMEATYVKSGGRVANVYGLTDETLDSWDEATICYNNAPGMLPPTPTAGNYTIDPSKLTLLGTITTPTTLTVVTSDPGVLVLNDFIKRDTNGLLTLVLIDTNNGEDQFATKENTNTALLRPTLTLPNAKRGPKTSALDPIPANNASDVYRDTNLSWTAGVFAATHDVYLGASFDDVNTATRTNPKNVLVSQGQSDTMFDPPGHLAFDQTYYWRVDEVNAPPSSTIYKGPVWSFTVEPRFVAISNITATASSSDTGKGPENTVNGSGLDPNGLHSVDTSTMWLTARGQTGDIWIEYSFDRVYKLIEMNVWNYNSEIEDLLGFGLKNVTIEYSTDDTTWTALGDFQFTRAPGKAGYASNTTVDFGGVGAQFVRITVHSGWGSFGQYGLSEVQFLHEPVHAQSPSPASGATEVQPPVTLSWQAGREAVSHDVYFGTDANTLPMVDSVVSDSYDPAGVLLGQTYYWRIDEVNQAASPSLWSGDVWSFSTAEYRTVDDFESYTDDDGNRIYQTWQDGWGITDNGSQVGHEESPFAEHTIIHGGTQSMPLYYDNSGTVLISEAERTWDSTQDWTAFGADTLMLYYRGYPVGFEEISPGSVIMGGVGADIFGTADEFRLVSKQLTGDGTIVARVDSLVDTDEWALAGVMIRQNLDPGSTYAGVFLTGSHGVRARVRVSAGGSATSDTSVATAEQMALTEPVWIKLERSGSQFTAYYATDEAGTNWTKMAFSPQTVAMSSLTYIGLAVCSHTTAAATSAGFSGVATTGNVTGQWTNAEIGVAQPSNTLDQLYVTLKDSTGRTKTVPADANAVLAGQWQPWSIPFDAFTSAGVNMGRITTMIIGVGDKTNPKHGTGLVFIDDIMIGRPAE
jgi:hypothetical protein